VATIVDLICKPGRDSGTALVHEGRLPPKGLHHPPRILAALLVASGLS